MMSGRDQLGLIDDNITRIRRQVEGAVRHLESLSSKINSLRLEEGGHYRELAKIHLDQVGAGRVIERLDQTDHVVLSLMAEKKAAVQAMENDLEKIAKRRGLLEQDREARKAERDAIIGTLQKKLAETQARMAASEDYRLRKETAQTAVDTSQKAEEKAAHTEADLEHKGKPYRDDPLFMYLWSRRYSTPDYRSGGIIRALDGWVAKLIGYPEARADYHMLNELPLRLREHADRLRQKAEEAVRQVRDMERAAAEEDGIPQIQTELAEAEQRIGRIDDDIERGEKEHQTLLNRLAEFSAGSDPYTQKAMALQVAAFEGEDLATLYREAAATPGAEDDAVVAALMDISGKIRRLQEDIAAVEKTQQAHRKALGELEALRLRFRRSHYDTGPSTFPGGFGLGALLGQLLTGAMNSRSVWGEIERAQRFDPPMPDFRGLGTGGARGGFGGGGFSTGGGIGGGDFRTGGKF